MNNNVKLLGAMIMAGLMGGCDLLGGSDSSSTTSNEPTLTTSQKTTLVTDMVALDESYVPGLFYSNIGTQANGTVLVPTADSLAASRAVLTNLTTDWNAFKTTHANDLSTSAWSNYLNLIGSYITMADTTYATASVSSDVTAAHNSLESVRDTFKQMRSDVGISYLMDSVTETHHNMEPVVAALNAYNASAKDAAAQAALVSAVTGPLATFTSSWTNCMTQMAAYQMQMSTVFGMSTEKLVYLSSPVNGLATQMVVILNNSNAALNSVDIPTLVTELGKIKPTFVKMFVAFGDFIAPFRSEMVAMERAFVPALFCTSNPPSGCVDATTAYNYLLVFETEWNNFKKNYPVIPPSTNTPMVLNWKADMDAVDAAIATAKTAEAGAASLSDPLMTVDAHAALETVRSKVFHLRHTYENYDFIIDYLTAYHNAFEPAVMVVADNSLDAGDRTIIAAALPAIRAAFDTMNAKTQLIDTAEWQVALLALNTDLTNLGNNLTALEADILLTGNDATVLDETKKLKSLYAPFFKKFGAF